MATSEPSQDENLDEFWIILNPPLLPSGVEEIIQFVNESLLHDDRFKEIIYEPDMAGFKCIAAKGYQEILSPIITERAGFMTENTRLISGDVEKEPLRTEQGTPVDVDICEDEPQVIAWSEYHETLSTRDYEAFQFPHVMLSCDFKAVWRKLESYSCFNFRLTLDKLLKEATRRWCMPDAPDTIEKFQEYVKCQVLTSLHQSTVYIRTIEDGSRVEIALSKLDVMLAAIDITPTRSNIIAAHDVEGLRLMLRPSLHLGLARQIYLPPIEASSHNYAAVLKSATVRMATEDELKRHYSPRPDNRSAQNGGFSVFTNFVYRPRKPSAVNPRPSFQSEAMTPMTAIHRNERSAKVSSPKPSSRAYVIASSRSSSSNDNKGPFKILREGKMGARNQALLPDLHTSNTRITDWVEDVAAEDLLTFDPPVNKASTGLLIDFSNDFDEGADKEMPQAPQKTKSLRIYEDLLGDESVAQSLSPPLLPLTKTTTPQNPDLMTFSIAKDPPKSLNRTMNQKASRDSAGFGGGIQSSGNQHSKKRIPPAKSPGGNFPHSEQHKRGPAASSSVHTGDKSNDANTVGNSPSSTMYANWQQVGQGNRPKPIPTAKQVIAPQAAKGDEAPRTRPKPQDSILLKSVEKEVSRMTEILQFIPGDVQLELQFGRLYITDIHESCISSTSTNPNWDLPVLLESLNSEYSTKVNFESIISAKGADGDKVALIRAWGAPGWDFHVAHTAYELICHFRDSDIEYAFKVSIDAGSFHHEMRSLEEELSCIHIHCPTSAMDIKARISRTARSDWPSECNSFVESLIASLSVETDAAGEVVLHFSREAESSFSVVSAYIKHTARYQSKASSSSLLEVRLIRPLRIDGLVESEMFINIQARSHFAAANRVSCPPGQLDEWIEASILSARAENHFEENKSLSFAERTGWTCAKLEEDGVFRDICRPALSMVTLMDHIGSLNDNKQGPCGHASAVEQQPSPAETSKYEFW